MCTVSILVSNYIGEKSSANVRRTIKNLGILATATELIIISLFYFFSNSFFFFFSEEESVHLSDDMNNYYIYFLLVIMALDFFQSFCVGVLRGCEILNLTTSLSAVLYMGLHPILSSLLALYWELDLTGIYISEIVVLIILDFSWIIYIYFKLDIDSICNKECHNEEQDNCIKIF